MAEIYMRRTRRLITMDDTIPETDDIILCNSSDMLPEPDYTKNSELIMEHISKIIDCELEICCMENHNMECHFDGSITNKCSICDTIVYKGYCPLKMEMNGCFLAYSTFETTDKCNKDHIIFCYTCSHINLTSLGSLDDFYKQHSEKKIHREINKGKTMIENIADKIANGWIISDTSDHECVAPMFAVSNRCLQCFVRFIRAPDRGSIIHQYHKCNYQLPHFFFCGICMETLMPFFYGTTVFTHFRKILTQPLAQMLLAYL
jgi:hypothetical protein